MNPAESSPAWTAAELVLLCQDHPPPALSWAERANVTKKHRRKAKARRAALINAWHASRSCRDEEARHRGDDDEAAASDESPLQRSDRAHAAHAAHRCDGDDNDDAGRDAHPLPHSHDDGRADRVEVAW